MKEQLRVYLDRMLRMNEFDETELEKLRSSHVAVIGVGGLGSFSSLLLALNGVGHLTIVDPDIVEFSNLNRQILYTPADIGLFKVEAATEKLSEYVPFIKISAYPTYLNSKNIDKILHGVDIIVDGLDNLTTRYLINRYSIRHKVPYMFAGVSGFEANLSFLHPPETPCLECFYKGDETSARKLIMQRGIANFTVGATASLQVAETIKFLTGLPPSLKNKLLLIDYKRFSFDEIYIEKNPQCHVCENPKYPPHSSYYILGDKIYFSIEKTIDLECIVNNFPSEYMLMRRGKLGIFAKYKDIDIGLSKHGLVIIRASMINLANKIVEVLISLC